MALEHRQANGAVLLQFHSRVHVARISGAVRSSGFNPGHPMFLTATNSLPVAPREVKFARRFINRVIDEMRNSKQPR